MPVLPLLPGGTLQASEDAAAAVEAVGALEDGVAEVVVVADDDDSVDDDLNGHARNADAVAPLPPKTRPERDVGCLCSGFCWVGEATPSVVEASDSWLDCAVVIVTSLSVAG